MGYTATAAERKTILLVEAEEERRGIVSKRLAEAGYTVCAASDASEAMARAEEPSVSLIIVDDDLAGESGLMLTRFLHRNCPDVPKMLCTSSEYDQGLMLEALRHGVSQCLPKDSIEELVITAGSYVT